MALSKDSIKKLRAVKAAILAEPELYNQGMFPTAGDSYDTPCCFAGWAVWLNNPDRKAYKRAIKVEGGIGPRQMADALGITYLQACDLFQNWNPITLSPIHNAKEGARRIEVFIRSGGTK